MLYKLITFCVLYSMLPQAHGLFEDRQWLYFGEPDLIGRQNGTCENVVVLSTRKLAIPFSPNLTSTCTSSGGPIRLIFGEDVWSGGPVSNVSVRFDCDSSFSLLRNYSLIHREGDTMPANTSASIACDLVPNPNQNTTGSGNGSGSAPNSSESILTTAITDSMGRPTATGTKVVEEDSPRGGLMTSAQGSTAQPGDSPKPTAIADDGSEADENQPVSFPESSSTYPHGVTGSSPSDPQVSAGGTIPGLSTDATNDANPGTMLPGSSLSTIPSGSATTSATTSGNSSNGIPGDLSTLITTTSQPLDATAAAMDSSPKSAQTPANATCTCP